MRLTTRPVTAEAEPWDPDDQGPFARLAGSQFLAADGDMAVIRNQGGSVIHVRPGWLAVRLDGSADGEAFFVARENLGTIWEPA